MPLIFDPGEAYQFDWSHEYARLLGSTTRVKAAHMRLCHSRMQLVQLFPRGSQEMVFEGFTVESRKGAVVCTALASLRFPSPLIKPDVRISRIRLSDWLHPEAHGGGPR